MIVHTTLFLSLMILVIIDYILWSRTIWLEDYDHRTRACRYDYALKFTWALTDITQIGIITLQCFMAFKFSAPAETYQSKFLMVYQANRKRLIQIGAFREVHELAEKEKRKKQ